MDYNERDEKIYELYMSGRYGEPHSGQGKAGQGTITKLAKSIGLSRNRVSNIIEAIEFRKRATSSVTDEAPPTVIAETNPSVPSCKLLNSNLDESTGLVLKTSTKIEVSMESFIPSGFS